MADIAATLSASGVVPLGVMVCPKKLEWVMPMVDLGRDSLSLCRRSRSKEFAHHGAHMFFRSAVVVDYDIVQVRVHAFEMTNYFVKNLHPPARGL